jgi:hypothetical protein
LFKKNQKKQSFVTIRYETYHYSPKPEPGSIEKKERNVNKRFVKNKTKKKSFVTNRYETYLYSPEPEPGSIEKKETKR